MWGFRGAKSFPSALIIWGGKLANRQGQSSVQGMHKQKQAPGTGSPGEQGTYPGRSRKTQGSKKQKGRKKAIREAQGNAQYRPELALGRKGRVPQGAGRMPAWIKHRELCKPQAFC